MASFKVLSEGQAIQIGSETTITAVWEGTTEEYSLLSGTNDNTLYIITKT